MEFSTKGTALHVSFIDTTNKQKIAMLGQADFSFSPTIKIGDLITYKTIREGDEMKINSLGKDATHKVENITWAFTSVDGEIFPTMNINLVELN